MESESVGSWSSPPPPPPRPQPLAQTRSPFSTPEKTARTRAEQGGDLGSCFGCKQEGHWLRDCPSRGRARALESPDRTAGDWPELPCPCGAGPCLVLLSRTPSNPNRWFYRCPINQVGGCGFFKWCDTLRAGVDQRHGVFSPVKLDQKYGVNSPLKHASNYGIKSPINLNQHRGVGESSNPECTCGAGQCSILTMKDGDNAGRKYFACPIKKGHGACRFFQWIDSDGMKINHVGDSGLPKFDLVSGETGVPANVEASKPEGFTKLGGIVLNAVDHQVPANVEASKPEGFTKFGGIVLNAVDQQVCPSPRIAEPYANGIAGLSPMKRLNFDEVSPSTPPNLGKCFRCGQDGHWMRECTGSPTSTCFKCGKLGHWKKDCTS